MTAVTEPVPAAPTPQSLEEVDDLRERMRAVARGALGVTGSDRTVSLREGLRRPGASWYPLIALSALIIVDEFQGYAFFVLGPEIASSLGISKGAIAGLSTLKILALTIATLPTAAYIQRRGRRGALSIGNAFAWSVLTLFTGLVAGPGGLALVLMADGFTTGTARATHPPLLMDYHPPDVRVRALSVYRGADALGNIMAPLLVALLATTFGFTWRGIFIILGVVSLLGALMSIRLRDPGVGRWDSDRVRDLVAGHHVEEEDDRLKLGFFEVLRRLLLIPTVRRIMTASAVGGMFLIPLNTFFFFFLEERWGLGPGGRGVFFAVLPVFAIVAFAVAGRRGDALYQRDPAAFLQLTSRLLGAGAVMVTLSIFLPALPLLALGFGVASALFALVNVYLTMAVLSIVPASMRPHTAAVLGIFSAAVGGLAGILLLGGLEAAFGSSIAIALLVVPGVATAIVLVDRCQDHQRRPRPDGRRAGRGGGAPRAQTQRHAPSPAWPAAASTSPTAGSRVLFDVDFTVDEGEMVGAARHERGRQVHPAPRHLGHRPPQSRHRTAPGQRHHLPRRRAAGATGHHPDPRRQGGVRRPVGGRQHAGVRLQPRTGQGGQSIAGIEESFDAFPRLAERRNQGAATLSGGEQQMLALSKAFIVEPRLLLIDELSLGLAPKVVGELLDRRRADQRHRYRRRPGRAVGQHRAGHRRPRLLHGEGRDPLRRPRPRTSSAATTCCARSSSRAPRRASAHDARRGDPRLPRDAAHRRAGSS